MPNNDDHNQTVSSSNFGPDNQGAQQDQVPFTDLYTLLQLIRKSPILILGLRTDQVTVSTLSTFIKGYEMALAAHDIDEFGSGFEMRFGQFLRAHCLWKIMNGPAILNPRRFAARPRKTLDLSRKKLTIPFWCCVIRLKTARIWRSWVVGSGPFLSWRKLGTHAHGDP